LIRVRPDSNAIFSMTRVPLNVNLDQNIDPEVA
jgi:hypothetical protein